MENIIYILPTKWFSANISFALQKNPGYYHPHFTGQGAEAQRK